MKKDILFIRNNEKFTNQLLKLIKDKGTDILTLKLLMEKQTSQVSYKSPTIQEINTLTALILDRSQVEIKSNTTHSLRHTSHQPPSVSTITALH